MANIVARQRTNFARTGRLIIDLCGQVIRYWLSSFVDPSTLLAPHPRFNALKQSIFHNIHIQGNYNSCDFSFLYLLIRSTCATFITPTKGWGVLNANGTIDPGDVLVADDVERLRLIRNHFLGHTSSAQLPDVEYQNLLTELKIILGRFDTCHGG